MEILEIELLSNDIEGTYSFLYQNTWAASYFKKWSVCFVLRQYKIDVPIFKKQTKQFIILLLTYQKNQLWRHLRGWTMERKF
jgi:hypothetical protein